MSTKRNGHGLVGALALTCCISHAGFTSSTMAQAPGNQEVAIEGLGEYVLQDIVLPAQVQEHVVVSVDLDGQETVLTLHRKSLRSPDFKLLEDRGDGQLHEIEAPPHRTYRGAIVGSEDHTSVAASIDENGRLWAMIFAANGTLWAVQPLHSMDEQQPEGPAHVSYRASDFTPREGVCGNDIIPLPEPPGGRNNLTERKRRGGSRTLPAHAGDGVPMGGFRDGRGEPGGGGAAGAVAGTGLNLCELGIDSDYEFFTDNNSSINASTFDMEVVMNCNELIYERDVNITYEITVFIIRTSSSDPYSSNSIDTHLNQLGSTWTSSPESSIQRDVAQLMSGKTFSGGAIGLAYLNGVCSSNTGYGVVETHYTSSLPYRCSLTAHELGHNWGSGHCSGSSSCFIMCASNGGCGYPDEFGSSAQSQINSFKNAVSCEPLLADPLTIPFEDNFTTSSISSTRWIYRNGAIGSTSGVGEPSASYSLNLDATSSNAYADDEVRSNFILLDDLSDVYVSFYTQHRGVESGEKLYVEYFDWTDDWETLTVIESDGDDQNEFQYHSFLLGVDAYHDEFRLRFRTDVSDSSDDWYIDNVKVDQEEQVPPPANDECDGAIIVFDGDTEFDTTGATTSSPFLPVSCGGSASFNNDIWFGYPALCTGTVTISTCNAANFDTRISVYSYSENCPTSNSTLVACDDVNNECVNGTNSLQFEVTSGENFYVRVGSESSDVTGAGILSITCEQSEPDCLGDFDNNAIVDGGDLAWLLGNWGLVGGDLDGDGTTDGTDLAALLGNWGLCE